MSAELDALLADKPVAPPTFAGAVTERKRRHKHEWCRSCVEQGVASHCIVTGCGIFQDDPRIRRGKNARSRGNALERWVNHMLGISNRGKYGGPDDGGGEADWIVVQTKSGSYFPKLIDRWLRAVPQRAGQMRGVVLVETPGPGTKRRALLVLDLYEAADQWGGGREEAPE